MNGSLPLKVNKDDLKKNGKIWLIGVGALTVTFVANTLPSVDFGAWTPIVVVVATGILDLIRRWIADNS